MQRNNKTKVPESILLYGMQMLINGGSFVNY
jgi:hypothetical protein